VLCTTEQSVNVLKANLGNSTLWLVTQHCLKQQNQPFDLANVNFLALLYKNGN
jgi:hypothetical protein